MTIAKTLILLVLCSAAAAIGVWAQQSAAPAGTKPKLYNTAKQKLLEGKQVFSFTQDKFDPADATAKRLSTMTTRGLKCSTARWNSRMSKP